MIIAFWLEAWLTKQEILSRYLSSVYFGDGVYGLRAAAHHYFDREPENLTLAQSAMLAGMVQAPSRLAPTHNLAARAEAQPAGARRRWPTPARSARARAHRRRPARPVAQASKRPDRHLFRRLGRALRADQAFDADFGEVKVAHDARPRPAAARGPGGQPRARSAARRRRWSRCGPTARVVAMVGGRSYADSPFNRVTQARRQPGSAFKLFVYLAALRAGWTPDSMIEDKPITIDGWTPVNSDRVYRGQITLREAFARSSNAATVRLSQKVGRANVIRAARDLGITTPLPDKPSLALGTAGVSLLELTSAYAAVAGGRYPVAARGLADEQPRRGPRRPCSAAAARSTARRDRAPMLDLLYAAANNGTGRRAALAVPTFGKTGTTQDNRDALFVGFAGDLVVGVWVGRDDNKSLGKVSGGTVPAQIWRNFMISALAIDRRAGPPLPGRIPSAPAPARPHPRRARCPRTGATAPRTCATSPT